MSFSSIDTNAILKEMHRRNVAKRIISLSRDDCPDPVVRRQAVGDRVLGILRTHGPKYLMLAVPLTPDGDREECELKEDRRRNVPEGQCRFFFPETISRDVLVLISEALSDGLPRCDNPTRHALFSANPDEVFGYEEAWALSKTEGYEMCSAHALSTPLALSAYVGELNEQGKCFCELFATEESSEKVIRWVFTEERHGWEPPDELLACNFHPHWKFEDKELPAFEQTDSTEHLFGFVEEWLSSATVSLRNKEYLCGQLTEILTTFGISGSAARFHTTLSDGRKAVVHLPLDGNDLSIELLRGLQAMERKHGMPRPQKNGAYTMDEWDVFNRCRCGLVGEPPTPMKHPGWIFHDSPMLFCLLRRIESERGLPPWTLLGTPERTVVFFPGARLKTLAELSRMAEEESCFFLLLDTMDKLALLFDPETLRDRIDVPFLA